MLLVPRCMNFGASVAISAAGPFAGSSAAPSSSPSLVASACVACFSSMRKSYLP
jgi:hypothetical protein